MYERTYGKSYNKDLSTTEIAKLVRQRIKAMVKNLDLPKGAYSVRSQYYAGGSSIDIRIKRFDRPLLDLDYVMHRLEHPTDYWDQRKYGHYLARKQYTTEASEALVSLRALLDEYNHDGSDMQSDYFDVKFYGHVDFDGDYESSVFEALRVVAEGPRNMGNLVVLD